MELQLIHLAEILEVVRHCDDTLRVLNRHQELSHNLVVKITIALLQEITGSLMNILSGPEGTVGDIDVQSQTSASATQGRIGL